MDGVKYASYFHFQSHWKVCESMIKVELCILKNQWASISKKIHFYDGQYRSYCIGIFLIAMP